MKPADGFSLFSWTNNPDVRTQFIAESAQKKSNAMQTTKSTYRILIADDQSAILDAL